MEYGVIKFDAEPNAKSIIINFGTHSKIKLPFKLSEKDMLF